MRSCVFRRASLPRCFAWSRVTAVSSSIFTPVTTSGPCTCDCRLASGGAASMCTSALPSGEEVKLSLAASGGAIVW